MRVLLDVSAVPARPVGAGIYTIEIARGLDARGVELHLLTRRRDAQRWSSIAPRAVVHADAPDRRPLRLAWEQIGAPALARAVQPDVWHGPHYTMPLRASVPTVVTMHDLTFFDHPEWHERSKVVYFRRMIRAAAAHADVALCVSAFTAARLRVNCRVRGEVVVVPHGVDHERFMRATDRLERDEEALAPHGITPPYIAFSGTIEPRKDVPTLVRAFAAVARAHPDLRLVIAGGDGWGAAQARDAIAASGASTRVLRTGYLRHDTLVSLFRRASAVVYPSLEEGFGLPALEALACGAPLVSTRGSAVEEVVGDAALLVPPHDERALGDAIERVLDDAAVAARLRRDGPERAAKFTWDRSVAGHLDAYDRAIAARRVGT
ncbi:MAG TPA: glycosyltransferase family 1 protein [Acidimicrobiia bacterium]|nr:glycosyltransferase family 1 protein [Acidimicrobiia bacterium]